MKLFLPDASLRSPTAVQGQSDMRDENVFSALCLQSGGAGNQTLFTNPRGQAIPALRGAGIVPTPNPHQQTYTELTTNITQSGQLGSSIGDASFRAIGITIENAYFQTAGVEAGLMNVYGGGQQEIAEIIAKCFFQIRIGGKLQIQGPVLAFPASGGVYGSLMTTGSGFTVSAVGNGWPGSMRRLKLPILVARTDTVEATFGVAGGSSLLFSTNAAQTPGQPTLVWVNIHALVKGDAR